MSGDEGEDDPPPRPMGMFLLTRLVRENLPKALRDEYFERRSEILAERNSQLFKERKRQKARYGGYLEPGVKEPRVKLAWDDPEALFRCMQLYLELNERVNKHIRNWLGGESPPADKENNNDE